MLGYTYTTCRVTFSTIYVNHLSRKSHLYPENLLLRMKICERAQHHHITGFALRLGSYCVSVFLKCKH